jgi:hypothetical protein
MFYHERMFSCKLTGNYPFSVESRYPDTPRLREPALDIESWAESVHYPTDLVAHDGEIVEKEGSLRIAQDYVESKFTLHLHLRVRPVRDEPDACEFCAVVASSKGAVSHIADLSYVADYPRVPRELARAEAFRVAIEDLNPQGSRDGAADVEKPMLVYVVKPGKEGQVRLSRLVSKLIGLDALDKCPIIRAYAADSEKKVPLIPLPAFVDGELRSAGGAAAAKQDELPDEIVKRGPHVVAELPDDEPETRIGQITGQAENILTGIGIEVTDDAAIFLVEEGAPFVIERGQVLIRSFKAPIDGF